MHHGNVLYQAAKGMAADDPSSGKGGGLRKNSSQHSLLSMSSMNSSMSKGFWPGNRSKRSSFNSTIDYKRYVNQNKRKMHSKDLSIF